MSHSKKQKANEIISAPVPVSLPNLQRHFKEMYGFNLAQTEIMLASSSKSLVQAFENAAEALMKEDSQENLGPVFHGLKGLFLNMGENDWAVFARDVEQKLQQHVPLDVGRIVEEMKVGMADLLCYSKEKR